MRSLDGLALKQLDALREVANIGAGHAATALGQMTGRLVVIDVPEVEVLSLDGPAQGESVSVVSMRLVGPLAGSVMLVMSPTAACLLCDMLFGRTATDTRDLGEMERSGLQETANILAGAFFNAFGALTGMSVLFSSPTLVTDQPLHVVAARAVDSGDSGERELPVLRIATNLRFGEDETYGAITADLLIVTSTDSVRQILQAVHCL